MFRSSTAPSRGVRGLLGVALGLALLVGVASPALADPYGTGGTQTGLLPDDAREDYCFNSSFTQFFQESAMAEMNNLDGQTNMTAVPGLCGVHTDIVFVLDTSIASRAATQCVVFMDNNQCDRWTVRLNPDAIRATMPWWAPAGSFELNVYKTLCHEIGFAVGLNTSTAQTDCMYRGDVSGANFWQYTTYNAHHVAHMNSRVVANF